MFIRKNTLFSVTESDLDSNGNLHIPSGVTNIAPNVGNALTGIKSVYFPDSMNEIKNSIFNNNPTLKEIFLGKRISNINSNAFLNCENIETIQIPNSPKEIHPWFEFAFPNLKRIIKYEKNDIPCSYIVNRYHGKYYYETSYKKLGTIKVSNIHKLFSDEKDALTPQKICVQINNEYFFIGKDLKSALYECKKYLLMQNFERKIWEYKTISASKNSSIKRYELILREAIKESICALYPNITKSDYKKIYGYIRNLQVYIKYLESVEKKYKNTERQFHELYGLTFEELLNKITPVSEQKLKKTSTRLLKSRPIPAKEMTAIARAGYGNPGAFPYSWLKNIQKGNRSTVTKKLHEILKAAAIKMYTPEHTKEPTISLEKLSEKISKVIKQPIEIKYLNSGNFSKTYTMQIPGDKKYVWKIYHCDRYWKTITSYHHDTEIQNSFLISGKKYYGKIKFRKISTAGISNQLGETYLIYPYTEEETRTQQPNFSYACLTKPYSLIDRNENNILNNTLIDIGGLRINYAQWHQPTYISKISNTILYHSWNDLGYVLNNYTSSQIHNALEFVSDRISIRWIDFNKIQAKIEFLKNKTRYNRR